VSNVTDMFGMLRDSDFNQDLSSWNVANVTSCSLFNENTPQWILPKPNFTNCNPN
jgi:surface protein